jgi:flavin-dependent dehydrogenase
VTHTAPSKPCLECFDVVIFGAGPAGSSTAFSLAKAGFKVALLHRARPSTLTFGHLLSSKALPLLAFMGVEQEFHRQNYLMAPGTVSFWGSPNAQYQDNICSPYGEDFYLERSSFDAILLNAARQAGVTVFDHAQLETDFNGECWLTLIDSSRFDTKQTLLIESRFVVDATGRQRKQVPGLINPRVYIDRMIALVCLIPTAGQGFADAVHSAESGHKSLLSGRAEGQVQARPQSQALFLMIEANPVGWFYSSPVDDRRQLIALMTDSDLLRAPHLVQYFNQALLASPATHARVGKITVTEKPLVLRAESYVAQNAFHSNKLSVGDAALGLDPLAGMGILQAMQSGFDTAKIIERNFHHPELAIAESGRRHASFCKQYLSARTYYYRQERRWPAQPFWLRRQGHDQAERANNSLQPSG